MRKFLWTLGIVGLLGLSVPIVTTLKAQQAAQNQVALDQAIQSALTLCYAQEGFYPAQLAYLEDHYGLQVDEKLFFVYYKTFGSNIRPDVKVYRLGAQP